MEPLAILGVNLIPAPAQWTATFVPVIVVDVTDHLDEYEQLCDFGGGFANATWVVADHYTRLMRVELIHPNTDVNLVVRFRPIRRVDGSALQDAREADTIGIVPGCATGPTPPRVRRGGTVRYPPFAAPQVTSLNDTLRVNTNLRALDEAEQWFEERRR